MYLTELPSTSLFKHCMRVQLRFNDVDILGHINNTRYFSFYDTGKARFFEDVENGKVNWNNVGNVIANVDCAFIRSIFFGENIDLYTRCKSVGEKSFVLEQMLVCADTGEVKSVCHTVMVSFDHETKKSCPVPPEQIEKLLKYDPAVVIESRTTKPQTV